MVVMDVLLLEGKNIFLMVDLLEVMEDVELTLSLKLIETLERFLI